MNAKSGRVGVGVDAHGGPVVDPTANVLDLVEAAVKRIDDLAAMRALYHERLITAESRRVDEQAALRSVYDEKLRDAEAKRIDAIRVVDVNAVAVASARAADEATVLASQVVTSADTLRSLVGASASTLAQQQAAFAAEISKRLSELERTKYEGAGRSAVNDPALAELAEQVRRLASSGDRSSGMAGGRANLWALLAGGIALLLMILNYFK